MKKILIMLAVLGTVHFGAIAQTGTGGYNGNKMDQGDQGQKIDVIEGRKDNANVNNRMPATTSTTRTTTYHHSTTIHHTYATRKTVHHAVHHTYAKGGMHKTTHGVAMHHKTTHRTTHAVAMHRTVKHSYSGNRMRINNTSSRTSTTVKPYVDPAKNQNADVNRKIPTTPYPGSSDGGWGNGTNGKSGTNSEDGTIRTDGN